MEADKEKKKDQAESCAEQDHSHAWKGTWDRPMKLDEKSLDPLTVARMTDHNVRGRDEDTDTVPMDGKLVSVKRPDEKAKPSTTKAGLKKPA